MQSLVHQCTKSKLRSSGKTILTNKQHANTVEKAIHAGNIQRMDMNALNATQKSLSKVCQSAGPGKNDKPSGQKRNVPKIHQVAMDADDLSSDESIYNVHAVSMGTEHFVNLQKKTLLRCENTVQKFQTLVLCGAHGLPFQNYREVTSEPFQPSTANFRLYDNL